MRLSTVSVRIRQEIASLQISCWSFDNQLYCRITPCFDTSTMLRIETLKSWISMLQCIISQFVSSTMTVCRRIVLIKFESLIRHRMCVLQSFGRGSLSNNLLYSTTQRIHRTSVHSAPFFDSQRNKYYENFKRNARIERQYFSVWKMDNLN